MKICALLVAFLFTIPPLYCTAQSSSYQGWLKGNMVMDGQIDTVSFRVELIVDGAYLLEPQYSVVSALEGHAVKTSEGQYAIERKEVGQPHRKFQHYYLFNLATGTVSRFGESPDSLQEIYPNDLKKSGYKLDGNRNAVIKNAAAYTFKKDTMIGGHPWKIIEQPNPQPGISRSRILLRTDLTFFPVHPLSQQLDALYGGTALTLHYFTMDGHDMGVQWDFEPGLSPKEYSYLQKFTQARKTQ